MFTPTGKGVSKGIAAGPVYFYRRKSRDFFTASSTSAKAEKLRLEQAKEQALAQLAELTEKARETAGEEAALLFETHAMFVEDEDFADCMEQALERDRCTAEQAVAQAGERFSALFAASEDDYMRQRAADIQDVARRLLDNLLGVEEEIVRSERSVILAAEDLSPSETIRLDKSKVLGFLTQAGSGNSHTAILARTLGIPAICGLGNALEAGCHGHTACIDGETGTVAVDPDEPTLAAFKERLEMQRTEKAALDSMKGKEDVTQDGRRVMVYCNIGSPQDVEAVLENDGRGVGLFRSEFLYLGAANYPGEEEQFAAYRSVAAAMKGKRVVIRTLDIGADKQADYFHLDREENPALGIRGIRLCLERPEVFRTQLRALYRASAYGRIAIMFPMITSVWEVRACKELCGSVMAELEGEGVPFNRDTELGIMIETPASVFMAPELAREVDFFSVGTNDLSQYTLACDRQANNMDRFFDAHHPAILRALKLAADAAHDAGIWIGICGDLAADLSMLRSFLALGIDELSVPAGMVLPLRACLRNCRADLAARECQL